VENAHKAGEKNMQASSLQTKGGEQRIDLNPGTLIAIKNPLGKRKRSRGLGIGGKSITILVPKIREANDRLLLGKKSPLV